MNIIDWLIQSGKETLIKRSGSTQSGGNERIRSGQSYLYKQRGMESEVIEVRFNRSVFGSFLNQALMETMKRYPYFNTRLIEKNGDFYIVQNDISLTARKTKNLPHLGGVTDGYHLIDITYYGKSVYISFHHALCDGRGVKPFVETLIWYYCRLRENSKETGENIRKSNEPLLDGETVDPFMTAYKFDENKEYISLSRDAYAIPENVITEDKTSYRYELTVPHSEYMAVCKQNNATPVILAALCMCKAIAEIYPDYDKPINANIATDMREALGTPNTYKNCVKSMILPFSREFADKTLTEQSTEYRRLLNAQRDYDYCRREATSILGLFNKLDGLEGFKEKQKIMTFFEGMLLNTFIISYLGQFNVGENACYIDSIHLYNSGTAGLGFNMISCGDKFIFDFKQSFPSDKYVKAFAEQLKRLNLSFTVTEVIPFVTPEDKLLKRKK